MLKVIRVTDEVYICNQCNQAFNIRDALFARGNIYFCSSKCVLNYEGDLYK